MSKKTMNNSKNGKTVTVAHALFNSDLAINTDKVRECGAHIKMLNAQIDAAAVSMNQKVRRIDASWDGDAFYKAINKYNELYQTFCTIEGKNGVSRYKVIDVYVRFLDEIVGINYEETENANISLAESFM